MKALVLQELKSPLVVREGEPPRPGPDEVVVELRAAALNRRDYWITQGKYPGIRLPVVLGSDGAGVVTAVGGGVDGAWLSQEVIINPGWDWGPSEVAQADTFRILGMPDDGTFATHIRVPAAYLHPKPPHLNWYEAAALPLAGLTAFRALVMRGGVRPGETVLVTGAGGGVAACTLQFAIAAKALAVVTSSSPEKIQRAVALGAKAGFDYRSAEWMQQLRMTVGAPNLIVDGAGGEGYGALIDLAAFGGRIVSYGATAGLPARYDLFKVFWKQLSLLGSTMGSPADFSGMLAFVNQHELRPVVDEVFDLADAQAALDRLKSSAQFGKIVLRVSDVAG